MSQGNEAMQLGLQLRDRGIDRVVDNNREWVESMRAQARRIARSRDSREVTVDDLRPFTKLYGTPISNNAWGGIFRGSEWKLDRYRPSARGKRHGGRIGVWKLVK